MKSKKNKTEKHNKEVLKEFMKNDMNDTSPYFIYLKKNNGELHILQNIFDVESKTELINQVHEEFNDLIKKIKKRLKIK